LNKKKFLKTKKMKTEIEIEVAIEETHTQLITNDLAKILADEFVLSTKTRNAHWNVTGSDFYDKHIFFEIQFGELDAIIDTVAERIRKIGHFAPASLKSFLELTQLTEMSREKNDSQGFIKELLFDHNTIIFKLREYIHCANENLKDVATIDFMTQLLGKHEKMAWFLRSHLQ